MKERGEFFLASNPKIPINGFILTESDIDIQTGDHVINTHLVPILTTLDADLADKLFCRGIAINRMRKGIDVLLMTHPDTDVKM